MIHNGHFQYSKKIILYGI